MYLTFLSTISTNSLKLYLGNRGDKWLFPKHWRLENIVSITLRERYSFLHLLTQKIIIELEILPIYYDIVPVENWTRQKRVEKIRYTTTVPFTIGRSCSHIIASRNELKQPNAFFPRQFFTCLSIFSSEKYHLIKHIYLIWLLNFIGNSTK